MENVTDYINEIIKLNPEISKEDATKIANEDHKNYKELRKQGYSDVHAKRLSASIRCGIYL
jgi:hypothetical protein